MLSWGVGGGKQINNMPLVYLIETKDISYEPFLYSQLLHALKFLSG